jgi:hypothetical protein
MPSYKKYLEEYQQKYGKYPEDHLKLEGLYKVMADQVK